MEIVGRLGNTGVRGGGCGGSGEEVEEEEEEVRLRTVIGTSEQPPEGAELAPLHDRFLFAAELSAVSHSARLQLLDRQPSEDEIDCRLLDESLLLTVEEMDALKVRKLPFCLEYSISRHLSRACLGKLLFCSIRD